MVNETKKRYRRQTAVELTGKSRITTDKNSLQWEQVLEKLNDKKCQLKRHKQDGKRTLVK